MTAAGDNVPERMVAGAALLLAKHGYQSTTFATVLEQSKAPRGSVYHHFPEGKEQLIAAAVDLAGARALELTRGFRGLSAPQIVDAFVAIWQAILSRSEFTAGCSIVAVTVSADVPELVERAAGVFRAWTHELAAAFREAGVPPDEAEDLAITVIAACEGATVICRAQKSLRPLTAVRAHLEYLATAAVKSSTHSAVQPE